MHVSSLYGDYSVGSFGSEALEFIDFLAESGFSVWQVLPFGMTDEYNSPYKSLASLGANPLFIDLPTLFRHRRQCDRVGFRIAHSERNAPFMQASFKV